MKKYINQTMDEQPPESHHPEDGRQNEMTERDKDDGASSQTTSQSQSQSYAPMTTRKNGGDDVDIDVNVNDDNEEVDVPSKQKLQRRASSSSSSNNNDMTSPDLVKCVQVLQSITNNNKTNDNKGKTNGRISGISPTSCSPKELADQYTAAVGLLLHLRKDQQW
jgi:hypothetical protein